jgi:hypothetical protein
LAGLQPHHDSEDPRVEHVGATDHRRGLNGHRDVKPPANFRSEKLWGRHTHDRERDTLDNQRRSDHIWSATEAPLPEPIADDRYRVSAAEIVLGCECPAQQRRHAKRLEEVAAGEEAISRLDFAAPCQIKSAGSPCTAVIEDRALIVYGGPDPGRVSRKLRNQRVGRNAARDDSQMLRISNGQVTEQQAIDERKDRRVRTDAQRERQGCDSRDDRRGAKRSDGEPKVLHGGLPRLLSRRPFEGSMLSPPHLPILAQSHGKGSTTRSVNASTASEMLVSWDVPIRPRSVHRKAVLAPAG